MNIEFEEKFDKLFVRLFGELDHHNAVENKSRIEMKLTTNTLKEIVIDLNGLTFMDSSGISLVYNAYKIALGFNQKVTVMSANEKHIKILMLSGLDKFVPIIDKKECKI